MCLSGCREGHESDQTLEGRKGRQHAAPTFGDCFNLGGTGRGLGADHPLHGLGNCTAPPYTASLIPAISLAPSPGTVDL